MAEALALATSVLAVIQLTAQLASLSYGYISGVKRAPEDIQNMMDELKSFTIVLTNLQDYAKSSPKSIALQQLKDPLEKCQLEMENLLKKLKPKKLFGKMLTSLGWPLKEKETSDFISRIERYKSLFMLILETDDLSRSKSIEIHVQGIETHVQDINTSVQDVRVDIQDLKNDSARWEDEQKRADTLNWLYPGASNARHLEISSRRQKNTGLWIFNTPEVQDWIQNLIPKSRLIWGYVIPGAGKTFLSLAKQLTCQIPSLPTEIKCLLDKLKSLQQKPTLEELYKILLVALKSFTRTFIVCDALDEYNPKFRLKLLPLFHRMKQDSINLFLTSREYPEDIQDSLSSSAKIRLWAKDGDIASYIEQKIDENPRAKRLVKKGNYQDKIISKLTEFANGMFLLVHFHIEYLCKQTTTRQLLAELERLKNSSSKDSPLNPTYDRAMEIIQLQPKTCVDLAFKTLSWLVKAREVLTIHQLQTAVSMEEGQTNFDEEYLPDKMTLLDVCAGLVTIDEKSKTIRLAHYTVQEYLLSNPVISRNADLNLVKSCITFLSLDVFAQGIYDSESASRTYKERYPFYVYAVKNFFPHLKDCDENLSAEAVLRFLQSQSSVGAYLQVLSYENSLSYLRARHDSHYKYKSNSYYYPMQKYDSNGPWHKKPLLAILKPYDEGITTPLHIAAALGHCTVVRLIKNTNIMAKDEHGNTAIHIAASHGNVLMVKLLLENGADINAKNNKSKNALYHAVINKHLRTEQLLLEKGANILAIYEQGETILHHAVDAGRDEMVRLLLEKGADVLAADNEGKTTLHLASSKPQINKSLLNLLLEGGSDVHATDNEGKIALHYGSSSYYSNESIVKLLLEKGSDVFTADNWGKSALYYASFRINESIVKLLLEKDAKSLSIDNKV